MKHFILFLSLLFIGGASADSIPTSVGYVDTAISALQNKISAVDNNTVLTTTNTTGEIGQKSIYDANGNYAEQQNALVTAEDANAAIQTAIDTEFVCTEWLDGAEHTNDNCLIYDVRPIVNRSKNLFDINIIPNYSRISNNGDGTLTITGVPSSSAVDTLKTLSQLAPDLVIGKTYTFSFKSTNKTKVVSLISNEGLGVVDRLSNGRVFQPTQAMLDAKVCFQAGTNGAPVTISDVQIEEGSTATPYVPYGNIYMPSGN